MGGLPTYMSVHYVCTFPMEAREDTGFLGTKFIEGCEMSSRCWQSKPGSLQAFKTLTLN